MPFNQRFTKAIQYLQDNGLIKFEKDLMSLLGWKRGRMTYLKSEESKGLSAEERDILEDNFPQINWKAVNSGDGELISEVTSAVEDPEEIYNSKAWKRKELLAIKLRKSTLPWEEQRNLLVERLDQVEQALLDIQQINQMNWLDTMKELIKSKK